MTLYKVLNADGSAYHGGNGVWHLPHGKRPGKWMPKLDGELVPCKHGYHLCRASDLVAWLGPQIYEAECDGECVECVDKIVVRRARLLRHVEAWNEKTARLFAADCAERVLPIYERDYPTDSRPREAIVAARAYARGEIDAAAGAAAGDAARDAAGDAELAWQTARLMQYLRGEVE